MEPDATTLRVIKATHAVWGGERFEDALEFLHPDVVYSLNVTETLSPFAGATRGREAFAQAMRTAREHFEFVLFRPMHYVIEGEHARNQVEFMYRHRASGEMLQGRYRSVWRVQNGLIVSLTEYADTALIAAFMKLYGGGS